MCNNYGLDDVAGDTFAMMARMHVVQGSLGAAFHAAVKSGQDAVLDEIENALLSKV